MDPGRKWRQSNCVVLVMFSLLGFLAGYSVGAFIKIPPPIPAIVGLLLGFVIATRLNRVRDDLVDKGTREDWERYGYRYLFFVFELGFAVVGLLISEGLDFPDAWGALLGALFGLIPTLLILRGIRKRFEIHE